MISRISKIKNEESIVNKYLPYLVLLFVYVVLFEFILPVNKVLPKPTLLWQSLIAVWSDYSLLQEISLSTLIIYSGILSSFLILYLFRTPILKLLFNFGYVFPKFSFLKYFPAFFYAVIFAYWFPDSPYAEFLFVFVAVIFYLMLTITQNTDKVNKNLIDVAANLNLSESEIYSEVIWKNLLPYILDGLIKIHFLFWIIVLLYEYVGDYFGIGHVYNTALQYNDFSGLFSIAVYVALLIKFGSFVIEYTKSRMIYWK
jgi:NitT/TauT family transport system permease protein